MKRLEPEEKTSGGRGNVGMDDCSRCITLCRSSTRRWRRRRRKRRSCSAYGDDGVHSSEAVERRGEEVCNVSIEEEEENQSFRNKKRVVKGKELEKNEEH